MMNSGAPKENENPTILSIQKQDRLHSRRTPLQWSELGHFKRQQQARENFSSSNFSRGGSPSSWMPITAEDRSVMLALSEISQATNGIGVSLLQHAGLSIPQYPQQQAGGYNLQFEPSSHNNEGETKEQNDDDEANKSQRQQEHHDRFDAEEAFDIIRNIQDPEHPNTLEELGVVSLEQVDVLDEPSTTSATTSFANANIDKTASLKSRVSVRFT